MKNLIARTLVVATSAALLATPVFAQGPAAIKYRQATMRALAGHLGAASVLAKGEFSAQSGHLGIQVEALARTATLIRDLFPENSRSGETAALPAIWERSADFGEAVASSDTAAAALAATPKDNPEALGAALAAVGKTCGGCHGAFREKKQ